MLPSADADGSCERGTSSGMIACHAGIRARSRRLRGTSTSAAASGASGPRRSRPRANPRSPSRRDEPRSGIAVDRTYRRARRPAVRGTGTATCPPSGRERPTSRRSDGRLSSHCAPTVSIQLPMFEPSCATKSARKIGRRSCAQVDSDAGGADETSACAGAIAVTRTPYHAACLVSFPRKFSCAIPRGGPRSDQGV
jgi:hypothetical protein